MPIQEPQPPQSLEQVSREQLEIYARELQASFHKERRLRQELQERNGQLEQRVREITALNQMFQEHLRRTPLAQAYVELREGLQRLVREADVLLERDRTQSLPDTRQFLGLDLDGEGASSEESAIQMDFKRGVRGCRFGALRNCKANTDINKGNINHDMPYLCQSKIK